jgi:hypothetical protein
VAKGYFFFAFFLVVFFADFLAAMVNLLSVVKGLAMANSITEAFRNL